MSRSVFNVMKLTFPFNPGRNLGRSLTLVIIAKMQIAFVEVNLKPYLRPTCVKNNLCILMLTLKWRNHGDKVLKGWIKLCTSLVCLMLRLHLSFYQGKQLLRSSYLTLVHSSSVYTGSNNSSSRALHYQRHEIELGRGFHRSETGANWVAIIFFGEDLIP